MTTHLRSTTAASPTVVLGIVLVGCTPIPAAAPSPGAGDWVTAYRQVLGRDPG